MLKFKLNVSIMNADPVALPFVTDAFPAFEIKWNQQFKLIERDTL